MAMSTATGSGPGAPLPPTLVYIAGFALAMWLDRAVPIGDGVAHPAMVAVGGMLKRHLAPQTLERLLRQELIKEESGKPESKIYAAVKGIFTDKEGKRNGK